MDWSHKGLSVVREQLESRVRDRPDDRALHRELFSLYAVLGEWDRCRRRLDVIKELEPDRMLQASLWSRLIAAEEERRRVLAGESSPQVFGEPDDWIGSLVAALQVRVSDAEAAAKLRDDAFAEAPTSSGNMSLISSAVGALETVEFEWIADADGRLGPVLEAVLDGQYYWIPFNRLKACFFEEPTEVTDAIWLPCRFENTAGGELMGFAFARYAQSEAHSDELRLARTTEWESSHGVDTGLGQRMLTTDMDDYGILSIRSIIINQT